MAACCLLTNGKRQSFPLKLFLQCVHKLLSDLLLLHGEKMKKVNSTLSTIVHYTSSKITGHSNGLVNYLIKKFYRPGSMFCCFFFVVSSRARRESADIFTKAARKLCFALASDLQNDPNQLTLTRFSYVPCRQYLIELEELLPFFLCAAASDGGDVQHAITEFNECASVEKKYKKTRGSSAGGAKPSQLDTIVAVADSLRNSWRKIHQLLWMNCD